MKTMGDYVTPRAIEYSFRLMFEDRFINILAYNLETILLERVKLSSHGALLLLV